MATEYILIAINASNMVVNTKTKIEAIISLVDTKPATTFAGIEKGEDKGNICTKLFSLSLLLSIVKIDKYTNAKNKIIYEITYEDTIINKTIWITEDNYEQYVNNNKLVISDTDIEYLRKVII